MTEFEQGSEAWKEIRLGKVTASRVADVIAKTKSGYSTSRANYAAQLIAERLTGKVAESYSNAAMQWGTEQEPEARLAYEFRHDAEVQQVAFVDHPTIPMTGASPDGLIGDEGMIEIKCPITATHLDTLRFGDIPTKYETQMLWQMACTGRKWCDFVSYDPRLPENMRLFVKRLFRDETKIAELQAEVQDFLREVEDSVSDLVEKYGEPT